MLPALIPIAVSLASKFIPELIGKALDSKDAEAVAKVVVQTAKGHFPALAKKEALAQLEHKLNKSPSDVAELREGISEIIELEIKDVQHARETFKDDDTTDRLAMIVMKGNPILIGLGIFALVYVSTLNLEGGVLSALSAVIGAALNQWYQERQQVMNYKFGSSIGSKLKNK